MNTRESRRTLCCLLSLFPLAGMGQTAKEPPVPSASNDPAKLDQIVVSADRVVAPVPPILPPVDSITAAELQNAGAVTSTQEAIRALFPQFVGSGNSGAENANTQSYRAGGGSSLSRRNLRTLVLIDGRRVLSSGSATGNEFVNLDYISPAAIHSVEVFADGSSTSHGARAIGGVVNITTASLVNGGRISGFYEVAPKNGGWESRGGDFSFGHGLRTRFAISGNWSRQDPLWAHQREFSETIYGGANIPGRIAINNNYFVLNPALSTPPISTPKPTVNFPTTASPLAPDGRPYFGPVGSNAVYWGKLNPVGAIIGLHPSEFGQGSTTPESAKVRLSMAEYTMLLYQKENLGGVLKFEHAFHDRLSVFADYLGARSWTYTKFTPQGFGLILPGSNPTNPFNNQTDVSARVLDRPREFQNLTHFGRLLVGLRGRLGASVHFETAIAINRSKASYFGPGNLDLTAMRTAANAGRLNLFRREVSATEIAANDVLGTASSEFDTTLDSWDGRASFDAVRLPGGAGRWTIGAEIRRETLAGTADDKSVPNELTGSIGWGGIAPILPFAAGKRTVAGLFLALKAPLVAPDRGRQGLRRLEVTIVSRGERYSDLEDPIVSSANLRWQPFGPEFLIRASAADAFSAPTLHQTIGPARGSLANVQIEGIDRRLYTGQVRLQNIANPVLQPERGDSVSAGIVYTSKRWAGLSVDLDYLRVRQRDQISRRSPRDILQDVEWNGPASKFVAGQPQSLPAYDVRFDPAAGSSGGRVTAPGQVAQFLDSTYLFNPHANLLQGTLEAVDLGLKYRLSAGARRSLDATVRVAYTASYVLDGKEAAGHVTNATGTIPRWHAIGSFTYRRGEWRYTLLARAIASVYADLDGFETGSYRTVDAGVAYGFPQGAPWGLQNLELSVTVKNATDASPRLAPATFTISHSDLGAYNPLGRTFLFRASRRF